MKTSITPLPDVRTGNTVFPLSQHKRRVLITTSLIILDFLALGFAFWAAYQLRFVIFPYGSTFDEPTYRRIALFMIPVWIIIFAAFQLYNHQYLFGGLQEYSRIFNAILAGIGVLILFDFLRNTAPGVSRGWLILSWALAFSLVISLRFTFRRLIYALRVRGHLLSPALIVGANNEGRALAEQLRHWRTSGMYIVGFFDVEKPVGSPVENGYRVMGNLGDLEKFVLEENIEEIIIAPTALSREQLLTVFGLFNHLPGVNLRLSSGLFEIINTGLRVKEFASVPLIEANPIRITGFDAFLKTLIDYLLTVIILFFIWPILILIGVIIKIDSPGPVIHRRRVMGTNGVQFDAFKFRTMYTNGDEILEAYPDLQKQLEHEYKLKDDPRVTRTGKFIRKYSLDELPQFFNVLLNQMSLVGPRMISPPEMDEYGQWGINLLTVKPGISGQWQISGRSDISYQERVNMDMYYIRNWTIWTDIYILLATIPAVIRKKGAY
jgi:exopolysaccharide biosynthesis polyprenyl glycosylphosphotransferase